jgi:two-component system, OmpR family, sensor histidine kinase MtrB
VLAKIGVLLRRALGAFLRLLRDLPARWRRSIQFRVISVTMALSIVIATGLGYFIVQRVAIGVLDNRQDVAANQAAAGFTAARSALEAKAAEAAPDQLDLEESLDTTLCNGSANANEYQVLVRFTTPWAFPVTCGNLDPGTMPASLVTSVVAAPNRTYHEFGTVGYQTGKGPADQTGMALLYGQLITINPPQGASGAGTGTAIDAEIYYVFPLATDQNTLNRVEESLVLAGLVLILALAGIAWFVTRQVVLPVRMAAGIAERLAAGRFEERMRVRGEDDLASLATSFNKMAANLQSQIRRLEELSRVQRRFVSDVSHELRTPLTTVRMAADLIHEERENFDPTVSRSAELLQTQLDRFEELLADLLEISRFDAGAAILDAEPVDLGELVKRVVDNSEPLAQRKGSRILIDAPAQPAIAEVDTRRIDRIVRNLVVNAIEHGEGHDIVIKILASEDAVAIAVRDHGVGLRPGESSLVFNRFWRADPARARTTGGTGLGLAIALEDARLHHGWLQAWGEPGGGSQFRLTVPRTTGAELLRSPIPLEPEDSNHHRQQRRRQSSVPPPPRLVPRVGVLPTELPSFTTPPGAVKPGAVKPSTVKPTAAKPGTVKHSTAKPGAPESGADDGRDVQGEP